MRDRLSAGRAGGQSAHRLRGHGIAYERFTDIRSAGAAAALRWRLCAHLDAGARRCVPGIAGLQRGANSASSLQQRFGWRAGRFSRQARRASYPLQLVRARSSIGQRAALIGNAAQALHPVAAQGFNLGLRDAAVLAELIATAPAIQAPTPLLAEFARRRASDRRGMIAFTDRLVRLFAIDAARSAAARRSRPAAVRSDTPGQARAVAPELGIWSVAATVARVAAVACGLARHRRATVMRDALSTAMSRWSAAASPAPARRRCWRISQACPASASCCCRCALPPVLPASLGGAAGAARGGDIARQRARACGGRAWERLSARHACALTSACGCGTSRRRRTARAALCFDAADVGEPNLGYIAENATSCSAACLDSFRRGRRTAADGAAAVAGRSRARRRGCSSRPTRRCGRDWSSAPTARSRWCARARTSRCAHARLRQARAGGHVAQLPAASAHGLAAIPAQRTAGAAAPVRWQLLPRVVARRGRYGAALLRLPRDRSSTQRLDEASARALGRHGAH